MNYDDPVILDWGDSSATEVFVIWLHGLGADGHDFESIIPELGLPADIGIRFIFPNAPVRPVTINGGAKTRSWYDIAVGDDGFTTDESELRESSAYVEELIQQALSGATPPEKLFLAGFSQGGAVILHTALRTAFLLSGVIALSTYLPLTNTIELEKSELASDLDIFLAHGRNDPVINIDRAIRSRDQLLLLGANVDWHEYEMAHSVCMPEILELSKWLSERL